VWNGMRSRLRNSLSIDDRAYTVPTIPGLEDASHTLLAAVRDDAGFPRTVLVAHSAGGVISRRVAQLDPARVSGIITVGTPHVGALISERGGDTGAGILAAVSASFYIGPCVSGLLTQTSSACKSYAKLAVATAGFIAGEVYGESMGQPGSKDLDPDSPFIAQVNSVPESFRRIGITHRVPNSGALARYLGERLGTNEYDGYSADLAALEYNSTRRSALFNFILATVQLAMLSEYEMGFSRWQLTSSCGPVYSSFGNCGGVTEPYLANRFYNSYAQYLFQQQALAAGIYLSLTIANGIWNWGTTDQQGGDAFIASASQYYPNVSGSPFLPVNVESDRSYNGLASPAHGGETRSSRTASVIEAQLQQRFGVQRRAF
jgi:pimeloyl-ACP methyl ester carboxylesterase